MSSNPRKIQVVVVGASYAGVAAATQLAQLAEKAHPDVQVTLIERRTFAYHAVGGLRASVDEAYAPKVFASLDRVFAKFTNQSHQVILGAVVETHAHHLVLQDGRTVNFDYLVLATGSDNTSPAKILALEKAGGLAELAAFKQQVEQASSVLIIGGGPVGVEWAGEIRHVYPQKPITLVHAGQKLIGSAFRQSLSDALVEKLEAGNITVVLNDRVVVPANTVFDNKVHARTLTTGKGLAIASDLQILATGIKVRTDYISTLPATSHQSLVDPDTQCLKVKPTLQLADPAYPHIFAPGDVNNLAPSAKFAFKAEMQGGKAVENIKRLIQHSRNPKGPVKLAEYSDGLVVAAVPVGPTKGAMQAFGLVLGDWAVSRLKGGDLFVGKFAQKYNLAQ